MKIVSDAANTKVSINNLAYDKWYIDERNERIVCLTSVCVEVGKPIPTFIIFYITGNIEMKLATYDIFSEHNSGCRFSEYHGEIRLSN